MTEATLSHQFSGRIEGGIDAIVIGAGADGLAASAYLGKAGLKTVLLESGAEIGGAVQERSFANGLRFTDGANLLSILDPAMIEDLDLYRYGLSYAARRLDSVYFFEDGGTLHIGGDLLRAAHALAEEDGGPAFQTFVEEVIAASAFLRPVFDGSNITAKAFEKALRAAPEPIAGMLHQYMHLSITDALDAYLPDGPVKTAMTSEAAFGSGAAPDEAFSFMALVRKWAGEASGLQGAIAYPQGGASAVIAALRRAAQAAKVDIRAAAPVSSILIEQDRVAGVAIDGGGQIRAPLVVASANAAQVFEQWIGPAHLDIELQRAVTLPAPMVTSAALHLALKGSARDERTRENMRRRLVFAPAREHVRRAFAAARRGDIPGDLIIETIFPGALDEEKSAQNIHVLSAAVYPLPFEENPDPERREEIERAILANLEKFAPQISGRIDEKQLRLSSDLAAASGAAASGAAAAVYASRPSILQQLTLARSVTGASISGLYFCGAEAQIGAGLSGAAGRNAAKSAVEAYRRGGVS